MGRHHNLRGIFHIRGYHHNYNHSQIPQSFLSSLVVLRHHYHQYKLSHQFQCSFQNSSRTHQYHCQPHGQTFHQSIQCSCHKWLFHPTPGYNPARSHFQDHYHRCHNYLVDYHHRQHQRSHRSFHYN